MKPRTFLITGASKGIGLALSQRLANRGHVVVGIARHVTDVSFPGHLVSAYLSNDEQTQSTFSGLAQDFAFDGVVNNIGLVHPEPLGKITLSKLDEVFRFNLWPAVRAVQTILPNMLTSGWGRIVNISSLTILGAVHRTSYAAAKSALASFSRSWALELAATGITVNTVAPGPTETEMFRHHNPPGSESEQRYIAQIPMGRFASADEIAAAIDFLLSEHASFITGQTLFVDGGASIGKSRP